MDQLFFKFDSNSSTKNNNFIKKNVPKSIKKINRIKNFDILDNSGLNHVMLDEGTSHFRILDRYDAWLSTGLCLDRKTWAWFYGFEDLIKKLC